MIDRKTVQKVAFYEELHSRQVLFRKIAPENKIFDLLGFFVIGLVVKIFEKCHKWN